MPYLPLNIMYFIVCFAKVDIENGYNLINTVAIFSKKPFIISMAFLIPNYFLNFERNTYLKLKVSEKICWWL